MPSTTIDGEVLVVLPPHPVDTHSSALYDAPWSSECVTDPAHASVVWQYTWMPRMSVAKHES